MKLRHSFTTFVSFKLIFVIEDIHFDDKYQHRFKNLWPLQEKNSERYNSIKVFEKASLQRMLM